jgi:hypothetical protein
VTGDQFSVRAKKTKSGIRYKVVDEYGSKFKLPLSRSEIPLSLGELLELIDKTKYVEIEYGDGLTLSHLGFNYNGGADLESLEGFVSVESAFYPDLNRYYEARVAEWFEEQRRELAESDDDHYEEETQGDEDEDD